MNSRQNFLAGKRVLMVLAHCDDELVCGWPVLQDPTVKKCLLIVSSDRKNKSRQWCAHRKFVTEDLCRSLDIPLRVLDYDSEFYRLDHRSGKLANAENQFLKAIRNFSFDLIFTHNPHGEYGHLDHRFLFELLVRSSPSPLLITDIALQADWTNITPDSARYKDLYYRHLIGNSILDSVFYRRVQAFYETRGAWTWSIPPTKTANIYLL
jgi:LmbE family N-acetylglucosaminyl deacetylase